MDVTGVSATGVERADACPPWCETDHDGEHEHRTRIHRSSEPSVPVVARTAWVDGREIVYRMQATEFEIGLSTADGETDTWLFIGDGADQRLEVTTESARRLLDAIRHRLE